MACGKQLSYDDGVVASIVSASRCNFNQLVPLIDVFDGRMGEDLLVVVEGGIDRFADERGKPAKSGAAVQI